MSQRIMIIVSQIQAKRALWTAVNIIRQTSQTKNILILIRLAYSQICRRKTCHNRRLVEWPNIQGMCRWHLPHKLQTNKDQLLSFHSNLIVCKISWDKHIWFIPINHSVKGSIRETSWYSEKEALRKTQQLRAHSHNLLDNHSSYRRTSSYNSNRTSIKEQAYNKAHN